MNKVKGRAWNTALGKGVSGMSAQRRTLLLVALLGTMAAGTSALAAVPGHVAVYTGQARTVDSATIPFGILDPRAMAPQDAASAESYFSATGDGGDEALAANQYTVAAGSGSLALGLGSSAYGSLAGAIGDYTLALGYDAQAYGNESLAGGHGAQANGNSSTVMGGQAPEIDAAADVPIADEDGNTPVHAASAADYAAAFGAGAQASSESATAIGTNAAATGHRGTAVGFASQASGDTSVAVGDYAQATGAKSTALGGSDDGQLILTFPDHELVVDYSRPTIASGFMAVAVGSSTTASGDYSTAVGAFATAGDLGATVFGNNANALSEDSTAVGRTAIATNIGAVAFGSGALADGAYSVALGYGSNASDPYQVAVGSSGSDGNGAFTRRISYLSAGVDATDAVNMSQLNALDDTVADVRSYFASTGDGNDAVEVFGNYGTAAGSGALVLGDGGSAFGSAAAAVGINSLAVGYAALAGNDESVALGDSAQALADNAVALGAASVADRANTVSVGAAGTERQIANVAAGTEATDAVNLDQLNAAVSGLGGSMDGQVSDLGDGVAAALGGGASFGSTGLTAPGYVIQGATYGNVGDAFSAMDGALSGALQNIDTLTQQVGDLQQTHGGGGAPMGSGEGLAIGNGSLATDPGDTAIGDGAQIGADNGTAVGSNATISASATDAVAIGANSSVTATATNSVALGAGSVADEANTVSVGSAGHTRKVTNVAAGTRPTDAANVSQVDAALTTARDYADAGDRTTLDAAKAYTDKASAGFVNKTDFDTFRGQVDERFTSMGHRIDRIGAIGSAMSIMAGASAGAEATPNRVSAAVGGYRGQGALALGYSVRLPGSGNLMVGGALSGGGESTTGVGVSYGW